MRNLVTLAAVLSLASIPASAQRGPIDIIVDDIFGGGHKAPASQSVIDTIPVNVDIESLRALHGHSLIINAYAPAQAGMTQPLLIGQTRLLLNGLPNNLGLVIAVPEPVTRDLDFAVINGVVLDAQDKEVMFSQRDEFYRGKKAIQLNMIAPNAQGQGQTLPQGGQPPIGHVETLKGKVDLPSNAPSMMRGASLTVELVETDQSGLAGGAATETILGQTFIDIDQEKAPYKFTLDHMKSAPTAGKTLILRAYITDWAGRRIYQTLNGEPYRGEDNDYRVNLTATP